MKKLICLIMIAMVAVTCCACNVALPSDGTSGKQTSQFQNDDKQQSDPEGIIGPEDDDLSYDEKKSIQNSFYEKAELIQEYSDNHLDTAMTQSDINIESGVVFEKWDALLNEVYRYLKTEMPESEFKQLESDELAWIAKKEKAIDEASAQWEGGTGEPMARNMTAIEYTRDRCHYLMSLID